MLAQKTQVSPKTTQSRDRDLVTRLARGDEEVFRGFFWRYAPTTTALAPRIAYQPFLAEEIVQEVFLAVWRHPEGFAEQQDPVESWLLGMVHHRAVDLIRWEQSHPRRADSARSEGMVVLDVAKIVVCLGSPPAWIDAGVEAVPR
ncbi:MAG: hypothetical protein H0W94_07815 [Actinobacteria bacterium]|nr:hypothetical protein [Actinomycetota bacterium]